MLTGTCSCITVPASVVRYSRSKLSSSQSARCAWRTVLLAPSAIWGDCPAIGSPLLQSSLAAAPGETVNSSYLQATYPAILPTASWDTAWGSFELLLHPSVVFPPLRSVAPPERVSVQSALQQWLV